LVPKLQTKNRLITIILLLSVLITVQARGYLFFNSQYIDSSTLYTVIPDTLVIPAPVISARNDLDTTQNGNASPDQLVSADSTEAEKSANKFMLTAKIDYASADSLSMDIKNKMVWLYGNASIEYEDIKLKASLISIDLDKNTIHAYATEDSLCNPVGTPEFQQGDLSFKSKEIAYNFTTKKGLIQNVITKEGDGYIHGSVLKKINDSVTDVGRGEYTTCDLEDHPHFSLKFTKAKVLSGNMIVTGPAWISVEGVPLPLVLPFGLFPNKKGRSSGLIIPTYGEMADRGFFLENGGYYFGLNDYFDLKLTGDIYSRGSWALKPIVSYKKRYRYSGNFSFKYAKTISGYPGDANYYNKNDFNVNWSHRQDPKSRPNSIFSASVNAGSSSFNKYNPTTVSDYLSNQFSSSVTYDLKLGNFGQLTTSARHFQNTQSHLVTLSLPEIAFGINRIYPFKRKTQTGKAAWYESINITYKMDMKNELNTFDSLVFKPDVGDRFVNGIRHSIPLSGSFKVMKYFSWSNSINFTERWYTKTVSETWVNDTTPLGGYINIDTITGFKTARDYSFSSSLSTTIYGMKQFKKGYIRAIRHVVRPSVGFSYLPDFGTPELGYWKPVQYNSKGDMTTYSVFGGLGTFQPLYGAPPQQKSGAINFGLTNNLEMKVRSAKDTITGTQKVMLIDNFSISTNYDLAKDSMRWSDISISARTTLFKKIQVSYNSIYSPYGLYHQPFNGYTMLDYYKNPFYNPIPGPVINQSQYSMNKKPLRFVNSGWNLSFGYDLKPKTKGKKKPVPGSASTPEIEDLTNNPQLYIDWDNPWSLHMDYNFSLRTTPLPTTGELKRDIIQTFRMAGDVNVTEKWKFSAQTGYDFEQKAFAYTSITIYRNLHCWEMRMSWIPYGTQKSWNFQINAKSSLLQDLKLTKKKDFRDSY